MIRPLIILAGVLGSSAAIAAEFPPKSLPAIGTAESVDAVQNPQQLMGWLTVPLPKPEEAVQANPDGLGGIRGIKTIEAYERVAPAVVYVTDGETGHGTGFFIREDGWIITNHHVIDGMPIDVKTGTVTARIVWGQLGDDGMMHRAEGYLMADVFRADPVRDLALLKLRSFPPGVKKVPYIPLAAKSAVPGETCLAIGHPKSGILWTLRRGEVSGFGKFPQDQLSDGRLFGVDAAKADESRKRSEKTASRQVLLSTCGLNPGDSGGPLVNEEGELIAVSFAVPLIDVDRGIDLGKFSFHVHLNEVQGLLKDWPTIPAIQPPSHLPAASVRQLLDLDEDGVPDSLSYALEPGGKPTGMLIDLDQDSLSEETRERIKKVGFQVDTDWDFEFAFTLIPRPAMFFDRDNDGQIDWVTLLGRDEQLHFVRTAEGWKIESKARPELPFDSPELNGRFKELSKKLF